MKEKNVMESKLKERKGMRKRAKKDVKKQMIPIGAGLAELLYQTSQIKKKRLHDKTLILFFVGVMQRVGAENLSR